jgi:hypothetical protein
MTSSPLNTGAFMAPFLTGREHRVGYSDAMNRCYPANDVVSRRLPCVTRRMSHLPSSVSRSARAEGRR